MARLVESNGRMATSAKAAKAELQWGGKVSPSLPVSEMILEVKGGLKKVNVCKLKCRGVSCSFYIYKNLVMCGGGRGQHD